MSFSLGQRFIDIIRLKKFRKEGLCSSGLTKKLCFFIANNLHYDDEKFNAYLVSFFFKLTGMKIGKKTYISRGFDAWGPFNIELDDYVDIGQHCSIQAFSKVKIEKYVHIAENLVIVAGSHNTKDFGAPDKPQEVTIGAGTWIGTRVTIVGGVKIGKGCVIGAGAVVTKDIPDFSIAVGVPCRAIKKREPAENIIHPSKNYCIDEIYER